MTRRAPPSLVAVGLLSMLGQVALLRELAVASFGVELVFLAGTALWLAAGAAGALAGGRWPSRAPRAGAERGGPGIAVGFLAVALLLVAETASLRAARAVLGGVPGAYLPAAKQAVTAAAGLAPAGAVLGWLFQRGAAAHVAAGGTLAAAYAWESLGGALGSVAATAALWAGVSNLALVLGAGAASALVAARHPALRGWALAAAAALAALVPFAPALDRRTTAWNHPLLADVVDTPYGRVAVVEADGQVVVFENDALSYESEGTAAEPLAHAAALQAPPGARVLVLGDVTGGLVREVLKHRPSRVVAVEGNEQAYRAVVPRLPPAERAALTAPGVEVRFEDPRAFVRRATDTFDVLLVGAPEPSSGATNRFYTVEFFRRCAARLGAAGVIALRLPSAENFWTPGQLARTGAVHAALREVFRDVLVLPGAADVLLASASPLTRDPDALAGRLRERAVETREVTPEYVRYVLTNDRAGVLARRLAASGAEANRDRRPVCYQQTARLWLGRVAGGRQDAALPSPRAALAVLAGIGAVALAAGRSRRLRRARRVALVAVASMAAMTIEGVVLLRYQAEAGALFRDLGVLLTSFMAGLVAGAAAFDRARAGAGSAPRSWGAVPAIGLAAIGAGLAAALRGGAPAALAGSSALLLATGAMLAAIFAAASQPGEGAASPGALYAADLAGGCAGSVLTALLLVLALGVDGTALAAAGLAALGLALLP